MNSRVYKYVYDFLLKYLPITKAGIINETLFVGKRYRKEWFCLAFVENSVSPLHGINRNGIMSAFEQECRKFIKDINRTVTGLKCNVLKVGLPKQLKFVEEEIKLLQNLTLKFATCSKRHFKVRSHDDAESSDKTDGTTKLMPPSKRPRLIDVPTESNVTDSKPSVSKVPREDFVKEDDWVTVYVDGACSANGTLKAKAGLGVWFYANCPYNLAEPVRGRKTNNVAEIEAAIRSIEQAHAAGISKLRIKTDSMFLINCVTIWRFSWMKKNWMTAAGKPVINKTDIVTLVDVMENLGVEVDWVHVKAHNGTIGNEAADFLARQGAGKSV